MKGPEGFATLLLLSLLPVILAGGLLVFSAFSIFKTDLGTLNLCRARQLETQNKAAKKMERLLKLNPQALKLRLAEARARKALALASKSANPTAIAAAEAFLLKVQLQRRALGLKQEALISSANEDLARAGEELPRRLRQEWDFHSRAVKPWLEGSLHLGPQRIPHLAVAADLKDAAPVYQPVPDFEEAQAWNLAWEWDLRTAAWARAFLKFQGRFERSCSTSIYSENAVWSAKLKKAKSLWKGFS